MRRLVEILIMGVASVLASGAALAAEPLSTGEVLSKIHQANEKEVDMGRMAAEHGNAKEVRSFGKTLVKDHLAAEKKVVKVAKDENLTLVDTLVADNDADTLPSGDAFDGEFVKMMVTDHQKTITVLETARDSTSDDKLKKLLNELLPVLQKHEDTARRLLDKANRS